METGRVEEHHKSQRRGKTAENAKKQQVDPAPRASIMWILLHGSQGGKGGTRLIQGNSGSPGEENSGSLQGKAHGSHRL